MEIFHSQVPVPDIIMQKETDPVLKEKLIFIQNILNFAQEELMLPSHNNYRTYVKLDRNYVVWNIFAAPELSIEARQWCYLFVGCLSYRGYFDESNARRVAKKLHDQGWDVYVGGVSAYSTLGWFHDPVLNTMLNREKWEIARLIFHELTHQKIYIKNDIDFNEALADSLARIGLMRWLETQPSPEYDRISDLLSYEDDFISLLLDYRQKLSQLYLSTLDDDAKRRGKILLLDELQNDYAILRRRSGGDNRYDSWINDDLNNAKLAAVSTYRSLVPYFMDIYESSGKNLSTFYILVESLAHCGKKERLKLLRQYPVTNINCL